jgi:hypothetical protein
MARLHTEQVTEKGQKAEDGEDGEKEENGAKTANFLVELESHLFC